MKLAAYNVENLFLRAVAMDQPTWDDGKKVLTQQAGLNKILGKPKYTAADKTRIVELLKDLGLEHSDENRFVILRQNRGRLVKRAQGGLQVVADGRDRWIGWVDLKVDQVNDRAVQNTARVINQVDADVIGIVEAESRPALVRFSELLPQVGGAGYDNVMLIDGNDDRGIDVGIMCRNGHELVSIRSHVDDEDAGGEIFSRDCAEYEIRTPAGNTVIVLVNHFKSKGFGSQESSNKKRKRQAQRVADIYKKLVTKHPNVAVVGDLNDVPGSDPLSPLLAGTNLKDIQAHSKFVSDGRPGTFQNGTASQKIDYILLSPALFARVDKAGVFRDGVWGGKNGDLFPHLPEIEKVEHAASDHAALWAELAV